MWNKVSSKRNNVSKDMYAFTMQSLGNSYAQQLT